MGALVAALVATLPANGATTVASSASALVGGPVTVDCVHLIDQGLWGAAEIGGSSMELDQTICAVLASAPRIRLPAGERPSSGAAVLTVAHEAGHLTGIEDEREADCFAEAHLRRTALALGYRPAQLPRLVRQGKAVSDC